MDSTTARRFHDATKYLMSAPDEDGGRQILMGTSPEVDPAISPQELAIEPSPFKIYVGPHRAGRLGILQPRARCRDAVGATPNGMVAFRLHLTRAIQPNSGATIRR